MDLQQASRLWKTIPKGEKEMSEYHHSPEKFQSSIEGVWKSLAEDIALVCKEDREFEFLVKSHNLKDIDQAGNSSIDPGKGIAKYLQAQNAEQFKDVQRVHSNLINYAINKKLSSVGDIKVDSATDTGMLLNGDKYGCFDTGWLECMYYYAHCTAKVPFVNKPQIIKIPNTTTLGLFGDWGTGFSKGLGAEKITNHLSSLNADYLMHLGDVYYVGSQKWYDANVTKNLPTAKKGLLSLNSNHDMFCASEPYFKMLNTDSRFKEQGGCSFFAMENDYWVVVGLDAEAFSSSRTLYNDGFIDDTQKSFLQSILQKGKPIIVATHNNPIESNKKEGNDLYKQVAGILKSSLKYWYCGHCHMSVAYKNIQGTLVRICGNSAMPSGIPSWVHSEDSSSIIDWVGEEKISRPLKEKPNEDQKHPALQDSVPGRIKNYFLKIELNMGELKETFINEDGVECWSATGVAKS